MKQSRFSTEKDEHMAYNRISPYCTKIIKQDGGAMVVYHNTVIVNAGPETVVLHTGGYATVTTKRKMNQASHQFGLGYSVFQKNYAWYVTTKSGTYVFEERYFAFDRETGFPLTEGRKVA